jgi:TolA-binding protein
MELDEWIFSDVEAINKKWTAHAEDGTIVEMKKQIANQQEELSKLRESQEQIASQQEEELRKLRELVEKILESQAAAATITRTASDSESVSDCEGNTNVRQME